MTNQLEKLEQLQSLITLLDSNFSIFGFSFGIDGLIGLVPGVGDMFGGLISLAIILRMRAIGVSSAALNKMITAVLIDVFVGSIPVLGDLFDFFYKVNERNFTLAKQDLQQQVDWQLDKKVYYSGSNRLY